MSSVRRSTALTAAAVGIVVALLIILLATSETRSGPTITAAAVGEVAPEVAGPTLDGSTYDLSDHRGQWVVVNFFAVWCTACRIEHPELVNFAANHAAVGDASVVSIAFNESSENVRQFFDDFGGDWPVLVGDTGSMALDFGVSAVPETYLVAPSGRVVQKIVVPGTGVTEAMLDEAIAAFTAPEETSDDG